MTTLKLSKKPVNAKVPLKITTAKMNTAFKIAKPMVLKKTQIIHLPTTEKAAELAYYYGFNYIEAPIVNKEDIHKTKQLLEVDPSKVTDADYRKDLAIHPEEKAALFRLYEHKNMFNQPQPVMLYYEGSLLTDHKRRGADKTFHMDILGSNKSMAEATLIKAAMELLKEEGLQNLTVHINSVGDKDSMVKFCKELSNFYRKHINDLSPHCKQCLKRDAFEVYECRGEKCQGIKETAPNPINFLTEASRQHFKEVLEFLETLQIPYFINPMLVCHKKIWTQTCFEIRDEVTGSLYAVGYRYNGIAKRIGFKKDIPAVGITVTYKKTGHESKTLVAIKPAKVFFVQLGNEAKLKSLDVLEILRKAKIPTSQSIIKDKLMGQMQIVENSRIPYMILMGQKEAMENSVIIREMATRSQEVVNLKNLEDYLKKLK